MTLMDLLQIAKIVQKKENLAVTGFRYFPANKNGGEEIRVYFNNGHSTLYKVEDLKENCNES